MAALPIPKVNIEIFGTIFNSATGNDDKHCILAVMIEREKIQKLNFDLLDPSDSMQNFVCKMNFDAKKGFQKI